MKIVFFKNEEHFHPRISYTWDNAEGIGLDTKLTKYKNLLMFALTVPLFIFVVVNYEAFKSNRLLLLAVAFLTLPVHEICHALFCWVVGKKVERMCFFPYKQFITKPTAYVRPAFDVWKKYQVVLFNLFPFIILSVFPSVLAIFCPPLRMWLLLISLLNLSASVFDIVSVIHYLRFPKGLLYFLHFTLKVTDAKKPVTIHRIAVTPKLDKIYHTCFVYSENVLTETKNVYDTPETIAIKQEFKEQFNME